MTTLVTAPPPRQPTVDRPPAPHHDHDNGSGSVRAGRIDGIDIARAVALIGMFTVHVVVTDDTGATLGGPAGWWLTAPSGRASVLFMLLAGTSLSLISCRGAAGARPAAVRRRGFALLVGGFLLTSTIWPASILEHYGMLFLLAPWLLRLRTSSLAILTGIALAAGPVVQLFAPTIDPGVVANGPVSGWVANAVGSLWLHGTYPLVVWFGVFCAGLLLGRVDLSAARTGRRLLGGGVAAIVAVNLVVAGFAALGVEPADPFAGRPSSDVSVSNGELQDPAGDWKDAGWKDTDWEDGAFSVTGPADPASSLLDTSPHGGRTAWLVESLGVAAAILGLSLLVGSRRWRVLRPLALLGSMSLTAYLVHIYLVNDVFDAHVADSGLGLGGKFAILVALQASLVLMAVLIRLRWRQGPFEWLLKQMTGRSRPGTTAQSTSTSGGGPT